MELAEKLARTPKILIVDDDSFIRFAFSSVQQKYYLEVDCADSPREGLIKIQAGTYEAVFLDMKFQGGESGMSVLRQINLLNYETHVVVMSGSINLHDVMAEANRLGVLSFMLKPTDFDFDYVVRILRTMGLKLTVRPPDDPGPRPTLPPRPEEEKVKAI